MDAAQVAENDELRHASCFNWNEWSIRRVPRSNHVPLTVEIAIHLKRIPQNSVSDVPDRVIAATALLLGLPLATRDGKIRVGGITTIW